MRFNLLLGLLIALVVAAATLWLDRADTVPEMIEPVTIYAPNETLADVKFTDMGGVTHNFVELKGRAVILNFWATWCAPCVAEMPQLLAIAKAYPEDLTLILVSVDFRADDIDTFFEKHNLKPGANVIVVHDAGKAISKDVFGTLRYPETILADRNGVMREKIAGAIDWTQPDIQSQIKQLTE